MCHEILKEDDDEVTKMDDISAAAVRMNQADHPDELLDDTNGNISDKLSTLTLNNNAESAKIGIPVIVTSSSASVNGNNIAENNDTERTGNNNKLKKKSKEETSKITYDSNDNKKEEDNSTGTLETNTTSSSSPLLVDVIKGDVINVNE